MKCTNCDSKIEKDEGYYYDKHQQIFCCEDCVTEWLGSMKNVKSMMPCEKECPVCGSLLEDNGKCSDVGSNNCQYQK